MTQQALITSSTSPAGNPGLALLRENHVVQLSLEERADPKGNKKLILRGEFGWVDKATENKRRYPGKLLMREFKKLRAAMEDRRLYGELDHPQDARTMLSRVSHIITSLEITPEGIVVGEAEVLPTERGKILEALLRAGCKVGVSSRGFGSTKVTESGEEEVQEDFNLVSYDVVADPAASTAYPDVFYEWLAREKKQMSSENEQGRDAAVQAAVQAAEAKLKEQFAANMVATLSEAKAKAREEARSELLSDPAVAGAKTALEAIKVAVRPFILGEDAAAVVQTRDAEITSLKAALAAKDAELASLKSDLEEMAGIAKEAGFKFFLERTLAGDAHAEVLRQIVGDVKAYPDSTALKAKLEAARAEITKRAAEEAKAREAIEARERELQTALDEARKQNEQLAAGFKQSLAVGQKLALLRHAEGLVENSAQRERVRGLVEASNVTTLAEVEKLVKTVTDRDPETRNEGTRARVRRLAGSGTNTTPLDEERSSGSSHGGGGRGFNGLDAELDELKALSGLGN